MKSDVQATICIPTVRRLKFFREALESAASQSFPNYEILVSVNSPERDYFRQVARVVEEVRRGHPASAIRMVQPPRFLHIADHTNFMVDEAASDDWCYLADDDRMEPGFLATLVPLLDTHSEAGFAFCDFLFIDGEGATRKDLSAADARDTHRDALEEGFIPHASLSRLALWNALMFPCSLFRRGVLTAFRFEPANEAADRDFWLRLADAPANFGAVYAPAPLVHYRLHEHQYSKVSAASQSDLIHSLERYRSVAQVEPTLHKRELARAHAKLGKALLDEGDRVGAWRALRTALRKDPFDGRTYRFVLQAALPALVLQLARGSRGGPSPKG